MQPKSTPQGPSPSHDRSGRDISLSATREAEQLRAIHISPTYKPNQMDAKLIIECVRWCMNETLRIFWRGDREAVAKAIREILQFDVPAIGTFEDVPVVQRTDLTAEQEVLLLLHFAGEQGFTQKQLT